MMKKTLCALLVLVLFFGIVSCKSGVVLEGYVVDAFHQRPLEGKKVLVDGVEYITDKKGVFQTPALTKESVTVEIKEDDHFEAFADQVVLYQKHNIRKFLMDARHPLDFHHEKSMEPYSYTILLQSGDQGDLDKVSMCIRSIPYDQSYEFTGTYTDESGKPASLHMVQIGFSFWYKDEYGNWQFSSMPPQEMPLWGMIVDPYVRAMYQFYHDRDYSYEVLPEELKLKEESVKKIIVKSVKPIELFEEMTLYMLIGGSEQGLIRKAEIKIKDRNWLGSDMLITFEAMNTPLNIAPPDITQ